MKNEEVFVFIIKCIFGSAALLLPMYLWTDTAPWLLQLLSDDFLHGHIGAGIVAGIILLLHQHNIFSTLQTCLIAITGVSLLAVIWEFFEAYLWISQNIVFGIRMNGNPSADYIQDLIVGIGAGILVALYYYQHANISKKRLEST